MNISQSRAFHILLHVKTSLQMSAYSARWTWNTRAQSIEESTKRGNQLNDGCARVIRQLDCLRQPGPGLNDDAGLDMGLQQRAAKQFVGISDPKAVPVEIL
jgi:hypothetical protein